METPVPPRLVLVCGGPGAGKTTLARGLGRALHLPVVVRDEVKTGYAATHPGLDWSTDEVRRDHGGRVFEVFHRILDAHLDAGVAVVAEAAWGWSIARRELAPRFARSRPVVLHVGVDPTTSGARYRARFDAGERHPAHRDDVFADVMDAGDFPWAMYVPPDDLPCPVVRLDGTRPPADVLASALEAIGD